jgi:hypothetical protein
MLHNMTLDKLAGLIESIRRSLPERDTLRRQIRVTDAMANLPDTLSTSGVPVFPPAAWAATWERLAAEIEAHIASNPAHTADAEFTAALVARWSAHTALIARLIETRTAQH